MSDEWTPADVELIRSALDDAITHLDERLSEDDNPDNPIYEDDDRQKMTDRIEAYEALVQRLATEGGPHHV